MSEPDADRPSTVPWPPIIYAVTLALAWGLSRLAPLPAWPTNAVIELTGAVAFCVGIALVAMALVRFRAHGTTFDPVGPASALATDGIYRVSRNPMYLGAVIAFLGLSAYLNAPWLLLLQPVLVLALTKLAIEREEAYLERRFGAAYQAYAARTRRWL